MQAEWVLKIVARFLICAVCFLTLQLRSAEDPAFSTRGYYITFMRMPTLGLRAWKQSIDCIQKDGGNTVVLWMGGGFRSKKFPITWEYNRDHKNVQRDFVGDLIDYAHRKKIKILIGFTPFAYDGVNQYAVAHPELKATERDGKPAKFWGIHSWGYNLCPSKPESQRFMLEYAREIFFDFYPNADGLLIESSDYAICFCDDCKTSFFEKEFAFVRKISDEVWNKKPDATIIVFPHYFSGRSVPGFNVTAAKETFDPRWTLVFAKHSAHIDPVLIKQSRSSNYWDDSPTLGMPWDIRSAAQRAQQAGIPGFLPSLEAFTFIAEHPENNEKQLYGKHLKPFGFDWLREGEMPYDELLIRVNRIAYREFARNPQLGDGAFKQILGRDIFGKAPSEQKINDLLFLQESWFSGRTWWSASLFVQPNVLLQRATDEKWSEDKLAPHRSRLQRVREIAARYEKSRNFTELEMRQIASEIIRRWEVASAAITIR